MQERIQKVRQRIHDACLRAQRSDDEITLVAISKYKPASQLLEAYNLGQWDFGENYVQEFEKKAEELEELENLRWHFTGHLQSRKSKHIAGKVALIHSVGSIKLLNQINKKTPEKSKQALLLQCNISQEESKSGFTHFQELEEVIAQRDTWKSLEIRGLMTMPPYQENPEDARPFFQELAQWRNRLQESQSIQLPWLSMGMSHDFEVAIEEGATHIRVGTALFGKRETAVAQETLREKR